MAESFFREKLRHAPQKEGGREILCDLLPVCVTPGGTSNKLDVQNKWEENTHTEHAKNPVFKIVHDESVKVYLQCTTGMFNRTLYA